MSDENAIKTKKTDEKVGETAEKEGKLEEATVADYFIHRGKVSYTPDRKCNVFDRDCSSCLRKHFSFPDTCNDGWKTIRDEIKHKSDCLHYINRRNNE